MVPRTRHCSIALNPCSRFKTVHIVTQEMGETMLVVSMSTHSTPVVHVAFSAS